MGTGGAHRGGELTLSLALDCDGGLQTACPVDSPLVNRGGEYRWKVGQGGVREGTEGRDEVKVLDLIGRSGGGGSWSGEACWASRQPRNRSFKCQGDCISA
eukprot:6175134-Pleurochrysis_carterae.AAC.2